MRNARTRAGKRASRAQRACIYCGHPARTKDHVPPKCLLEKPRPSNLECVPCCRSCNASFSDDEQYFLVLLGQIGTSPSLTAKVEPGGVVDRTLARSPRLDDLIARSLVPSDVGRSMLRPDLEKIHRVIRKVAFGLFVLRYGKVPYWEDISSVAAYPYNIEDLRPSGFFIATFTEGFRAKRWNNVQRDVFSYIMVRDPARNSRLWCVMDFHRTLWGVANIPNPLSVPARRHAQLRLF